MLKIQKKRIKKTPEPGKDIQGEVKGQGRSVLFLSLYSKHISISSVYCQQLTAAQPSDQVQGFHSMREREGANKRWYV